METLKAISMWQPWGSLWLSPNKRHETRHWQPKHRGRLLVHAAKKFVRDVDVDLACILDDEFGGHWSMDLPTGAIIGMVDLIDVIPTERLYVDLYAMANDEKTDRCCGNFDPERFAWRRGTYWRFPQPIPYRGHQSLFDVPLDIVAAQIAAAPEVCD
jgi:hypothetical protein